MREPSRFEIWTGRDAPPPRLQELRAGPITAVLEGIDLRYVRAGGVEVVRRLFVAVRDAAWGTVPPVVSGLQVEQHADGFRVEFEASHESGELRFRWRGTLTGDGDGRLEARMDGRAESDFRYNRIGFCVLHPSEHAGRPYRTRTPEGEQNGTLPDLIGQQRLEDGKLYPLFPSYDRLEIDVADGLRVRFDFEGDLFEMEDQRNWTDASFKTYSTQITLGWPWEATAGQPIVQAVRITPEGAPRRGRRQPEQVRIELGADTGRPVPPLGLGAASHGRPLTEREVELLRLLGPDHLRVDLDLGGDWSGRLEQAAGEARSLDAGLELTLHLGEEPEAELAPVGAGLAGTRVDRVIVLRAGEAVTDTRWVRLARETLGEVLPGADFVGGTDLWFTELNREPPRRDDLDAVAYSIAATVHADDDLSVQETPSVQGETVRSALALYQSLPVVVSPVTIRPRIWPFGDPADPRGLPFQVDQRQCALLGAAWTVASLKYLLSAGPASVTYFETTGWRGVLESEHGPPDPQGFPSRPGQAYPLYHPLADACEWRRNGTLVETRSSDAFAVDAFAVAAGGGVRVLCANLTPTTQRCSVGPLQAAEAALRSLDEETTRRAGDDPKGFRAEAERRAAAGGSLELELPAYGVVRVDA